VGLCADERLDGAALIREEYQGIRPAPGYPACPDHSEKAAIWQLLDAERNAGIRLTESFAMFPTAAVSGFYFSHPQAHYFGVGQDRPRSGRKLRAAQRLRSIEAERWLAPNLGYEPGRPTRGRGSRADAA
jgi:5-methyltetrahydrofolate--homocysteine methyltransferase